MDPKQKIPKKHPEKKPSKLFMSFALVIAFLLPYFMVMHFSHRDRKDPDNQDISLSKLDKIPSIEYTKIAEPGEPDLAVQKPLTVDQLEFTKQAPSAQKILLKQELQGTQQLLPIKSTVVKESLPQKQKLTTNPVKKDNQWQIINPRPGDSMAIIFHRLGLTAQNLHAVLQKNPHARILTAIKPQQQLRFLINKNTLEQLIIPINDIQTLVVVKKGNVYKSSIDSKKTSSQNQYVSGTIKGSLYNTAQRLNIPSKLVGQITQLLNKQFNFSRSMKAGDRISVVYEAQYIKDKRVGTGDVVAVSYTTKNKTFQAIKHTSANGSHNYYNPQGVSFEKAFSRYPLKFSHISSTFSTSRYHPMLRYRRAHKGIDLAAPIGTPIQAIGDGVITIIGRHNGYGNMIQIRHDKTYSTIYGHMLRFQKGLSRGSRIRRGQVIGYVGQTGLATGPHCHFELHVNNQPRNPTTVSIPTAASVPSREMNAFKAKSRAIFARIKAVEKANHIG